MLSEVSQFEERVLLTVYYICIELTATAKE